MDDRRGHRERGRSRHGQASGCKAGQDCKLGGKADGPYTHEEERTRRVRHALLEGYA
jgi:hypothetical protein